MSQTGSLRKTHNRYFSMRERCTIRKLLTEMLALTILLWAEAGLALLPGDQIMQCPAMMSMHGQSQTMAAADDAAANANDAMPCCPADPGHTPKLAARHPPCCSSNDAPERPLAFLVNCERLTSHPLDTVATMAVSCAPPWAEPYGELRSAHAPGVVKPVLDLKSELRI
jgi:hypothetical protein